MADVLTDVLVVGGTGKTGRYVVRELAERGAAVRAGSRHPENPPSAGTSGGAVRSVLFDWADPGTWTEAAAGADAAFLVGPGGVPGAQELVGRFLAAAPGIRRVVLLSVLGAEKAPDDGMPVAAWEHDVRASGRAWTVLQPNWFHQNFGEQLYLPALAEHGEVLAPVHDARVSYVDTRDVAAVAAAALMEPGYEYSVLRPTGPQALTFQDVAREIGRAAGRRVVHRDPGEDGMAGYLAGIGFPDWALSWVLGLFQLIREGVNEPVTDVVEQVTGRAPRSLGSYAAEAADAWRIGR